MKSDCPSSPVNEAEVARLQQTGVTHEAPANQKIQIVTHYSEKNVLGKKESTRYNGFGSLGVRRGFKPGGGIP